tara:strand:- start:2189 stop:2812 length:624 start_codon:yes stop_codon:yes gene_type:complete
MNEYLKGGIVGGSTVFIGYPLDTIKTCIQNKQNISYKISNLYKGISYPLGFSVIFNSTLFSLHNYFQNKVNNHFFSGFIAGSISAPILNTVELYKVNKQLNKKINYKNPLLGCIGTVMRESSASAFYFGIYFYMKEDYHPAISGGCAGAMSWIISYPIDTIKTRIQSGMSKTYLEAYLKNNLWKGFSYCLGRAILVNSAGFYIYESL